MSTFNNHASGYTSGTPSYYYQQSSKMAPNSAMALGAVGAVIGAVGATAASIEHIKGGQITGQRALLDVAKEAAGTGLATAAGGLVMRTMGMGGFVGLLGMFTVATGVKYFWNQAMDKGIAQPAPAEEKPKAAKKSTKK